MKFLVRCHDCNKIIWPWTRDLTSWGDINHNRRTADFIAHGECVINAAKDRHGRPHKRMATCKFRMCTNLLED